MVETWRGSDSDDAIIASAFHASRCSSCSRPLAKGRWAFNDDGEPRCSSCTHVCCQCRQPLSRGFWKVLEGEKWCRSCQQVAIRVAAECNALADRRRRVAAARSVVAAALATKTTAQRWGDVAQTLTRPEGWVPDDLTLARSRRHWRLLDEAMTAAAQTHQPREGGDRRPGDLVAAARAVVAARAGRTRR